MTKLCLYCIHSLIEDGNIYCESTEECENQEV